MCVAFVVNSMVATNVDELSTYVNGLSIKGTSLSVGINLNLAAERTMQDATKILNYKMSSFVTIWRQTSIDLLSRSCIEYRLNSNNKTQSVNKTHPAVCFVMDEYAVYYNFRFLYIFHTPQFMH